MSPEMPNSDNRENCEIELATVQLIGRTKTAVSSLAIN